MSQVLLVHPDADAWLDARPALAASMMTAPTAREARAYLAGTAFDAIYVGAQVEGREAIGALRDVLGLSTPIEPFDTFDDLEAQLAGEKGGGDAEAALADVAGELSRVAHALNNPLAVIAGNAQLGVEMARATGADPSVIESLEAIGEAAARLEQLFGEVAALRARVDQARTR